LSFSFKVHNYLVYLYFVIASLHENHITWYPFVYCEHIAACSSDVAKAEMVSRNNVTTYSLRMLGMVHLYI